MITQLRHARLRLALHHMQAGSGAPLLLLHELAGSAADWRVAELDWAGPVYALDLCGHGRSDSLRGGAYVPERWVADADAALHALGDDAWLLGAGVSAYVALLLAGARPESVRGAALLPGRGLQGGGAEPDFAHPILPPSAAHERVVARREHAYDPAVFFSESVIRLTDRARACAEAAGALVLCEDGSARPPWWQALYGLPKVFACYSRDAASALRTLLDAMQSSAAGRALHSQPSA